tara:strand:+ start:278 stop:697 length:420 start_codon:yes stop_codon:yes gene_type:complete
MAANTAPIFTLTPNCPVVTVAAANTARDGSGTLVTLFTAGADGSRIESITFTSAQATAAVNSAMVGRVFLTDNTGANPRLISEVAISAITASNSVIGSTSTISYSNGLIIPTGCILKVSQSLYASAADQMHVTARGGNY